jgi:hypothetical protein
MDWILAKNALVNITEIPFMKARKIIKKLERSLLLLDNGFPKVLLCAVYDGDDNYIVAIQLMFKKYNW